MPINSLSINQRLKKTKKPEVKQEIAQDWARNWQREQSQAQADLDNALKIGDINAAQRAANVMHQIAKKRFEALPNVVKNLTGI